MAPQQELLGLSAAAAALRGRGPRSLHAFGPSPQILGCVSRPTQRDGDWRHLGAAVNLLGVCGRGFLLVLGECGQGCIRIE